MPIKPDREYRNFANFDLIETRAEENENPNSMIVEGYASTFEKYTLFEFKGGNYIERYDEQISPDAFNDADLSDVVFLRDHEGQVLARTKNGLITLNIDEHGLHTKTDLSATSGAREMFEDIRAKNYTQMSFAFTSDRSSEDWKEERDGDVYIYTRIINRINKVFDISAVSFPANPYTDIGLSARSVFDGEIEKLKAERLEKEREARRKAAIALKTRLLESNL